MADSNKDMFSRGFPITFCIKKNMSNSRRNFENEYSYQNVLGARL